MDTEVNEKIKVWAFFDDTPSKGTSIFPIAMSWRRRLIKLEKLIFVSTRRSGQEKVVDLICASDAANFELEYNTVNYSWRLKKVMPVG